MATSSPVRVISGDFALPAAYAHPHASERHTVWDQPGGLANHSGAGDLDVIIYSARKWEGGDDQRGRGPHQPARVGRRPRLRHQVRHARPAPGPAGGRAADDGTDLATDSGARRRWVDNWLHRSHLDYWARSVAAPTEE